MPLFFPLLLRAFLLYLVLVRRLCFCQHAALYRLSWLLHAITAAFRRLVFVGAPLYVDSRGFFMRLWPLFADFVFVGAPLYVDSRGFFPRLWAPFADSAYINSPLCIDFVSVGTSFYVNTFGGFCVC
jgi:hypothetical protein